MNIGICDDEKVCRNYLKNELKQVGILSNNNRVKEYGNGEELLKETIKLDVLFLDIEMPGINGMDLMRKYKERFWETKVVFLTSHMEFISKGYEVCAYRYLLKPVESCKLQEIFKSIQKQDILSQKIKIIENRLDFEIVLKDIMFIESISNKLAIYTRQGKYLIYGKLKDYREELPEKYFYQIHKSYLVNMMYVKKIDKSKSLVVLKNDETILLGIRKKNEFIKEFMKFQWEESV